MCRRFMKKSIILGFLTIVIAISSCDYYSVNSHYKVIAHRGYWKMSDGADNSIMSLKEAARLGVDGVELDICKTKDDSLVVLHGMYHGDYYIPETDYNVLRTIKLSNGEEIPTFREYMAEASKHNITYFLDIKAPDIEIELFQILYQYGCQYKAKIECSSYETGEQLLAMDSNLYLVYTQNDKSPSELKSKGFRCIHAEIKDWKNRLDIIKEAKAVGLELSAWIVKSESDIIWCASNGIDYLIADNPLEAIQFRSNYE